jgi:hypothetical protein
MKRGNKELKALKRENERLRKELARLHGAQLSVDLEEDAHLETGSPDTGEPVRRVVAECPSCDNGLQEVILGRFRYHFCGGPDGCGHRKKIK